jgi:hypothetical protein
MEQLDVGSDPPGILRVRAIESDGWERIWRAFCIWRDAAMIQVSLCGSKTLQIKTSF